MSDATVDGTDELARVRAERDALRSQVEQLETRTHRQGVIRRIAVGLLIVVACLAYTAAVPGLWARRNFLDTDRFVDRVGPLVEDPAVQSALTSASPRS